MLEWGCLMTLSGRILPGASVMAEQENKNSNCQLPFPGPWRVLQPEREMRRQQSVDVALCKEPWLFAKCDTQVFRGPGPPNPILGVLSVGLSQAWGLPGDRTAAGLMMTG